MKISGRISLEDPGRLSVTTVAFGPDRAAIGVTLFSTNEKQLHTWMLPITKDGATQLQINRGELRSFGEMFTVTFLGGAAPIGAFVEWIASDGLKTTADVFEKTEDFLSVHSLWPVELKVETEEVE